MEGKKGLLSYIFCTGTRSLLELEETRQLAPSSNLTTMSSLQFNTRPSQPSDTTQLPCLMGCRCRMSLVSTSLISIPSENLMSTCILVEVTTPFFLSCITVSPCSSVRSSTRRSVISSILSLSYSRIQYTWAVGAEFLFSSSSPTQHTIPMAAGSATRETTSSGHILVAIPVITCPLLSTSRALFREGPARHAIQPPPSCFHKLPVLAGVE
mmetsp:Transcript_15207/g.51264  ORF Transcript_15207/g.51264 Transcript_15207/m.51264 type:complete len:211 (-) Transcript_15207:44-676(-)